VPFAHRRFLYRSDNAHQCGIGGRTQVPFAPHALLGQKTLDARADRTQTFGHGFIPGRAGSALRLVQRVGRIEELIPLERRADPMHRLLGGCPQVRETTLELVLDLLEANSLPSL
jgi:hypothetical protein